MSNLNIRTATNVGVISWNNGAAARAISEALSNGQFLKKDESPLPRSVRTIINLGCKSIQRGGAGSHAVVLNQPSAVQVAGSKIATFQALSRYNHRLCPHFWTDPQEAVFYAVQNNYDIVCRTVDAGHSGAGIVLVTQAELQAQGNLPRASVYVQAVQKRREYRVHVGRVLRGAYRIIDIARKVRRAGVPDGGVNGEGRPFIWNHGNDFIFQRSGIDYDESVIRRVCDRAMQAVRALDLDFGAVDVVVQAGSSIDTANFYVLEVNTSPGMEGTTLQRYIEFFRHRFTGSTLTPFSAVPDTEYENGGVDEQAP